MLVCHLNIRPLMILSDCQLDSVISISALLSWLVLKDSQPTPTWSSLARLIARV